MERRQLLVIAILFEGGALLLAWVVGALVGAPPLQTLRFSASAAGWGLLASGPLFAGLAWTLRSTWPPLVRLRQEVRGLTRLFTHSTVFDLAVISVLAGLCEEALFRGVVQVAMTDVAGVGAALVVASVVFGLAHFISPTYVVYAAVVGAYLGGLLLVFDNLLVPVVAHAAYDFGALLYLVRRLPV